MRGVLPSLRIRMKTKGEIEAEISRAIEMIHVIDLKLDEGSADFRFDFRLWFSCGSGGLQERAGGTADRREKVI